MNDLDDAISEFKDKCLDGRSFFTCELLKILRTNFKDLERTISKGTIMYRARAFHNPKYGAYTRFLVYTSVADEKDVANNPNVRIGDRVGFLGYNAQDSFVNPNNFAIGEGRCNYKFSPCLYAAASERVAISEIKPLVREAVSVAKITNKKELKLIDLRLCDNEWINAIAMFFVQSPTLDKPDAYIYTQTIAAFVKKYKYDGIIYSSCQVFGGINYAIFNYEKCEAVSSELKIITNILYGVQDYILPID